ncbi:hypothetical protein C7S18_23550 (plasmid) [Ahniella affigens]|uniref:Uncharacterized protein n=1 Tax=Ahniella affigens TaxID=2021234 RepID=A0A2P1PZN5_9GAMM|nr:hypothetical protein [Ahniella affigens]AVQ00275.1 hypothetical protein C7S18_23550 [Ahniella affigens]
MTPITLVRAGDRPLAFNGTKIASSETFRDQGPNESRHWTLTLYKTEAGKYVLAAAFRTRWRGEEPGDLAWHADTASELVAHLKQQDPLQYATGLLALQSRSSPATPSLTDPRAVALLNAWAVAVSDLLSQFPEEIP